MPALITRKLEFDAGHRLVGHESKCSHLHGHRYTAEIQCSAEALDGVGRVIDFSVIKSAIGGWIDNHWDHNLILRRDDPLLDAIRELDKSSPLRETPAGWAEPVFGLKIPFLMNDNPTVENMVEMLGKVSHRLMLDRGINVVSVRLYETPNCWADWRNLAD